MINLKASASSYIMIWYFEKLIRLPWSWIDLLSWRYGYVQNTILLVINCTARYVRRVPMMLSVIFIVDRVHKIKVIISWDGIVCILPTICLRYHLSVSYLSFPLYTRKDYVLLCFSLFLALLRFVSLCIALHRFSTIL